MRTGVAIGINTYRRLDPSDDASELEKVNAAVSKVRYTPKSAMAVFGFRWVPNWVRKGTSTAAAFSEVRLAWEKLNAEKRKLAITKVENTTRKQEKLPYGVIRNCVADGYGKQVAEAISSDNVDPVHIVTQDADGNVEALHSKGVLTAYDDVLSGMERHPLLTIGGYRFKGFDWGEEAGSRKQQLDLAERIAHAIIDTLTGEALKEIWQRLAEILRTVDSDQAKQRSAKSVQ